MLSFLAWFFLGWLVGVPVVLSLLLRIVQGDLRSVIIGFAIFLRHPWYRWVTREDKGLQQYAEVIVGIMAREGLLVSAPLVRRVRPAFDIRPSLAVYVWPAQFLLCSDKGARYNELGRFWIIGHEMGHHVDFTTKRKGHLLFDVMRLIDNFDHEQFADLFAWYCLEYVVQDSQGKPFDWKKFVARIPEFVSGRFGRPPQ